jgi:fatty-acyl-CoA synthase
MNGLMMDYSLTLEKILFRARDVYPTQTIVSRMANETLHRHTFLDFYQRTVRLMNALKSLGVKKDDRVATFAWNSYRHLELYFGIPCLGSILHTLNIRLFPEQLSFIVNHAEDQYIFVDHSLTKVLSPLQKEFKHVKKFILMDDGVPADPSLLNTISYEDLLSTSSENEDFPTLDENQAAALCYTSGTTGDPKGALYSHRSTYLHSLGICMGDSLGLGMNDSVLAVVPMFHVNCWGIPYACALTGAKPVFPGAHLIGKPIAELIQDEKITLAAGVPSIWNPLYQFLKKSPHDMSSLRGLVVGGSAAPRSMIENFEKDFGVRIIHAWGMTEMSPVGTVCNLKDSVEKGETETKYKTLAKQGMNVPLVEMKIVDENGITLPRDGKSTGELLVRGPWIIKSYYNTESEEAKSSFTEDGWFRTGDIASIDPESYLEITDRKKDLIKTRGEWLSSVEMENYLMSHESVLEATVVGRPDDVRGEAVVAFIVPKEGEPDSFSKHNLVHFLSEKFAKWQIPKESDIHVVKAIPKTSVGKFDKKVLRAKLKEKDRL